MGNKTKIEKKNLNNFFKYKNTKLTKTKITKKNYQEQTQQRIKIEKKNEIKTLGKVAIVFL